MHKSLKLRHQASVSDEELDDVDVAGHRGGQEWRHAWKKRAVLVITKTFFYY
jgi:hypothetical protein